MKPRARKPEPAYVQALNGGDWCGLENQMHTASARRDPELAILSTASSFDLCPADRCKRIGQGEGLGYDLPGHPQPAQPHTPSSVVGES